MVRITEDLVRKRAEHNDYEISSLEELSLHQQDIEKIEHLDKWCKELKILYLQSNLIPRIENVGRLKKLEYLNLALNNITKIENLHGCESLKKLDFTVNFIGEVTSIESLKGNELLREMYLTGNPCTQYEGYREYVIATLPQLRQLDGKEIEKSERIEATQQYSALRDSILQQQKLYISKKESEKLGESKKKGGPGYDGRWYTDVNNCSNDQKENEEDLSEDEKERRYWEEATSFTPESRIEMHKHIEEQHEKKNQKKSHYFDDDQTKRTIRFFKENGDPLNVNTAKINFTLKDQEDEGLITLDVACYKHLDTSLIDVDVQPKYIRVCVKENILQLVFMEEVNPDMAVAKRSQTTGHLVVSMPKASGIIKRNTVKSNSNAHKADINEQNKKKLVEKKGISLNDLCSIVKVSKDHPEKNRGNQPEQKLDDNFIDDPDVPPLI